MSIVNDIVYGIEHFEYGCYMNRKRSKYRKEAFIKSKNLFKKTTDHPNIVVSGISSVESEGNIHLIFR